MIIKLNHICKYYNIGEKKLSILKGISLDIDNGDFVSISGPSGCGKSTLMNIVGLLDSSFEGNYEFEGTPVFYKNDDEISRIRNEKIGFIFQQYNLLPNLNAVQNVGIPLFYRGLDNKIIMDISLKLLDKMQLYHRAKHKPSELSGGEQQRVAIARALVGNPSVILADEPTGALDTVTGQEIMQIIEKICERDGCTIIVVTHNPSIALYCHRNVYMKDGELYNK